MIKHDLSKPVYKCRRYNTVLKCVNEHRGYKKFIDVNGKTHECIKFTHGRQKICDELNVVSYIDSTL